MRSGGRITLESALPAETCSVNPADSHTATSAQAGFSCPICTAQQLQPLHAFNSEQAAEAFVPLRRDPGRHEALRKNIEGLWNGSTCQIAQCSECQFVFPVPYVSGTPEFYDLAYGTPSYPENRWEYDRAITLSSRVGAADSRRVLELGAGTGHFVKRLLHEARIPAVQIVATDYTSHSVAALQSFGIDARAASVLELQDIPQNANSFDVIFAFQSLEHMSNVIEVICGLKRMLKPGGVAIVSVPNGKAIEFNERYVGCLDLPPNHVGRWYKESFEALANRTGLELVAHEVEPVHYLQLFKDVMISRIHGAGTSNPRSLAGRVQAVQNRPLRRVLSAIVGTFELLPLLPKVFKLDSGYAQLAVLRKPS
jgi:SAM-dependent methyltransferase